MKVTFCLLTNKHLQCFVQYLLANIQSPLRRFFLFNCHALGVFFGGGGGGGCEVVVVVVDLLSSKERAYPIKNNFSLSTKARPYQTLLFI